MAIHGAGVLDEHRVPRSGESGGGSAGGGGGGVLAAVAAAPGDGDGALDSDAVGEGRGGDWEALGGGLQGGVPDVGEARAVGHGGSCVDWGGHSGGYWERDRDQDFDRWGHAAVGWGRCHRLGLVSFGEFLC